MTDPELPAKPEAAKTFEIDVEPTVAGRFARRLAEGRALRTRVGGAHRHHASLELAFDIFESDSSIGGGLLVGARSPIGSSSSCFPPRSCSSPGSGSTQAPWTRARARSQK